MPNHISNRLRIIGTQKQVEEVLEFIKGDDEEEKTIDFNKITPMPKWVYGSSPDVIGISQDDYKKWGRENTSLDWATKNWGTKWNAYGQPDKRNTEDTIYFETAWNGVTDLIKKLGWIFPDVILEYSFADEYFGSGNNGIYHFHKTQIVKEEHFQNNTKEAYELSFELVNNGNVPDYLKYDEKVGTYKDVE